MDFKTALLTEFLDCGYADIDFLEKEMKDFDVEIEDIEIESDDNFNLLIEKVYVAALQKFDVDRFDEEWEDRITIFTNCLDSHLTIDDEEMYSSEDISNFLKENQ
ncbi:MAG: hypothetical protein PF487_08920 [Bacteroidales bacterium]|jgi:hypothetical protein|nr:hypothetical protein [Bacteroidales bacterium]